ncbi:ribonuclease HII [Williamwhitmania taraxaci]|uniref:Ribonuclease HII n=1 Tax=Williamwhitmania taraxaci TaxID=1640674 RepID=A0A1G6KIE2_9BACT|nr:ribonuclease HII [Williamwhitmania taraxaci]SDC30753.1 RNase HII [Williamwhitmania taraxaci]
MLRSYYIENQLEAGCDEAGRGCLAGPVVAAAVILPPDFSHPDINDSKKLTEKKRNYLRTVVEENALAFAVAIVDAETIDSINILNASILGMHRALDKLSIVPEFVLVDGNRFKQYLEIPHKCIIKGDGIYASIAAASILAKTYRDELMEKLHLEYPVYGWNKNKGYPTEVHRKAIEQFGITDYHRKTFSLTNRQLKFNF